MQSSNKWLAPPRRLESPRFRLFALPYAGSGASTYFKWAQPLAAQSIELLPIQLPGRENRIGETSRKECGPLVIEIVDAIKDELNEPYALFGHSMGATLAYEVSAEIVKRGLPHPAHLFVSARNAPHVPWQLSAMDELSDEAFISRIANFFGNIPEAVLQEPELVKLITPVLRADFSILGYYKHQTKPPLPFPLKVLSGKHDEWTDTENLQVWQDYTSKEYSYIEFDCGHFFINELSNEVVETIATALLNPNQSDKSSSTFEL